MKKKILAFAMALVCALTCCSFAACNPTEEEPQQTACEHELTYHAATVTCTEDGTVEYWQCSLCDKYFADENASEELAEADLAAEKLNHKNKIYHTAVSATCQDTGTIEYWECPDCGKNFSDEACTNTVTSLSTATTAHEWEDGACKVCGTSYNDYYFTFTLDTTSSYYTVDKKTRDSSIFSGVTELIIPGEYNGKPVKEVAAYMLYNSQVESVIVEEGVETLLHCSLASKKLVSVSLPSTISGLSMAAFRFTSSNPTAADDISADFATITIAAENPKYTAVNNVVYTKSSTANNPSAVVLAAPGMTGSLTVEEQINDNYVRTVNECAFYSSHLTSLVLPDSITSIGAYAFNHSVFTSVKLPAQITALSESLFAYSSIENVVVIPERVTTIGYRAFYYSTLEAVVIPARVTIIEQDAFQGVGYIDVYYGGASREDYNKISGSGTGSGSGWLEIYRFYSYSATDTGENYIWHFDENGLPVAW